MGSEMCIRDRATAPPLLPADSPGMILSREQQRQQQIADDRSMTVSLAAQQEHQAIKQLLLPASSLPDMSPVTSLVPLAPSTEVQTVDPGSAVIQRPGGAQEEVQSVPGALVVHTPGRIVSIPELYRQAIISENRHEASLLQDEFEAFRDYVQAETKAVVPYNTSRILAIPGLIQVANETGLDLEAAQLETEFEQFKAFVQGRAAPTVTRIVRPVQAHLTQTEAGPLDVSQRADGTLAIMAPPTGLSVTHPTLSEPYTGPKPTTVSGMVDAGPAFTVMVDPASKVFSPADVLQTINILEAGSAGQMAKDARKTATELEEQLQLPPVMNYENIVGSLPADTQDTINQMVTGMVDRLAGKDAPSRITGPTEHISGAVGGPVIPGGDVLSLIHI